MLYIHPDECVDCGACEPVCPVEAIYYEDDVPDKWKDFYNANVEFFSDLGSPGGAAKTGKIGIPANREPRASVDPNHEVPAAPEPSSGAACVQGASLMPVPTDPNRVIIFDTTLRDGEQSPGCSMNLPEKLEMARALADLGVDVIEAGFPIASPGDFESVQAIARQVQGPVVAGLARCTLQSLRYHADFVGADFLASATASGRVTRRGSDGRYAFVEIDVELELELEPELPGEELSGLIASAERDCFVGASLSPQPRYRWRVNGRDV